MNDNKRDGNRFECDFCDLLSQYGFWVHNMAQNQSGQPADVIAVRDRLAYLIDCKVCHGRFALSRIEDNQHYAMQRWSDCGNNDGWFALKVDDDIYMLQRFVLEELKDEKASLNMVDIRTYGIPFDRWLTLC